MSRIVLVSRKRTIRKKTASSLHGYLCAITFIGSVSRKEVVYVKSPRSKMIDKCKRFEAGVKKRTKSVLPASVIIGLSGEELADYLLLTYLRTYGYSWDGEEEVQIDHILPLSLVKGSEYESHFWHYKNLQLLKAKDNIRKACRLDYTIN